MIYTVRVTTGQEKIVSQMLEKKAKAEKLNVYSIAHIENIKGYVFVEVLDKNTLIKLLQKMKHVKGFLQTPVNIEEITKLIALSKQPAVTLEIGDIVEMTSGPFKGEKAKVIKTDEAHDEVTVELIEVAVPIPITVKSKMVKMLRKSGEEESE
ncbi:MAG: transcription elongation factor Spt5 [Candidatus Bilamarchaeaceae archaeon]